MQGRDQVILALSLVTAFLIIVSGIAITLLIRQRAEIESLRAQAGAQPGARQINRPRSRPPPPEFVEPADPNPFAAVPESAMPGRYKWTKSGEEKGVITLNADHSFANEKGEKFRVYQWELAPDGLLLTWQRGPVRFTVVESPGVYVARRQDNQTERLEKVE